MGTSRMITMALALIVSAVSGKPQNETLTLRQNDFSPRIDNYSVDRTPYARAQGSSLKDWCDDLLTYAPCLMSGAECVPEVQGGSSRFCKCKTNFQEYASYPGIPNDRCAPVNTLDFPATECDLDSDCSNYGRAICFLSSTSNAIGSGKCTCIPGWVKDSTHMCKETNCVADSSVCNAIPGSQCQTSGQNQGKCLCPSGSALINGKCENMANYECDSTVVGKSCPTVTFGTIICMPNKRCVCQVSAPSGGGTSLSIGASLVSRQDNPAQLECRANTLGSDCVQDTDCPMNFQCNKRQASQPTGKCTCKPMYKHLPAASGRPATCELALGTCCRSVADCGQLAPPGPNNVLSVGLTCLRTSSDPAARGICVCARNNYWDVASKTCSNSAAACL